MRMTIVALILAAAGQSHCDQQKVGNELVKDISVTARAWALVDTGPLTVKSAVFKPDFNGTLGCFSAQMAAACGNSETPTADLGFELFSCGSPGGACKVPAGAKVDSGRMLCCGATKGYGGPATVTYSK